MPQLKLPFAYCDTPEMRVFPLVMILPLRVFPVSRFMKSAFFSFWSLLTDAKKKWYNLRNMNTSFSFTRYYYYFGFTSERVLV